MFRDYIIINHAYKEPRRRHETLSTQIRFLLTKQFRIQKNKNTNWNPN